MIKLPQTAQHAVAVLGLGRTGLAAAKALVKSGANVCAWDDNEAARAQAEAQGIALTDLTRRDLSDLSALVLSPGIPHTWPKPNHLVELARACDVPVIGDMELYAQAMNALPQEQRPFIIGITGTNGKSTTTALITHILKNAARNAHSGGNIGRAVLEMPMPRSCAFHVLELSSYQLELCPNLHANVAILLNLTPDHIERHGGFSNYRAAKLRLFANQSNDDLRIVGVDEDGGNSIRAELQDQNVPLIPISAGKGLSHGVFAAGSKLVLAEGPRTRTLFDLAKAPGLRGRHNAQNAAAAWAACRHAGLSDAAIARGLSSFTGLAHRMELLGKVGKVTFVNDSKATNGEAAARALSSYEDIFWIAGGRPKEDGLEPVRPYCKRVQRAYLIGEAAPEFAQYLKGKCKLKRTGTLKRAFVQAFAEANKSACAHPVVLLSPACASFDQFSDFEARGEVFRNLFTMARQEGANEPEPDPE